MFRSKEACRRRLLCGGTRRWCLRYLHWHLPGCCQVENSYLRWGCWLYLGHLVGGERQSGGRISKRGWVDEMRMTCSSLPHVTFAFPWNSSESSGSHRGRSSIFFHNSSKIECRWISLNAFEMSSAIMTQSGLASRRSVIAMINCDPPPFVPSEN